MDAQLIRIGGQTLKGVVVATTPWQRLRGWYGYHQLPVQGVLLTRCKAVHTIAMPLWLDLVWINRDLTCIGVRRALPAWRLTWCRGASHVLELREGVLDHLGSMAELVGQRLSWSLHQ